MHLKFLKVIVALNFEWVFPKQKTGMDCLMLESNLIVESIIDVGSTKKCCLAISLFNVHRYSKWVQVLTQALSPKTGFFFNYLFIYIMTHSTHFY